MWALFLWETVKPIEPGSNSDKSFYEGEAGHIISKINRIRNWSRRKGMGVHKKRFENIGEFSDIYEENNKEFIYLFIFFFKSGN